MKSDRRLSLLRVTRFLRVCLFVLSVAMPLFAARAKPVGILFLSFDSKETPSVTQIREGCTSVLQEGLREPFDVYFDSVDTLREDGTPAREHMQGLVTVLQKRYEHANIKVVIPVANNAIGFVAEHGREVFPGASMVFVATPFSALPTIPSDLPATGVGFLIDVRPTIDLALRQNPGTKHLFVIAGSSTFERSEMAYVHEAARSYGGKVDFQFVTGMTYAEVVERVSALPPHSIVLFLSFAQDSAGNAFMSEEGERMISAGAAVPVYAIYSSSVGQGAVGGQVLDFKELGRTLGYQVLRMLSGAKAGDIPMVVASFQHPMFDWQQVQRWHIREGDLPAASVIINREPSVWAQYRWWILAALALLLLQASLLAWLAIAGIRRRRAERGLLLEMEHEELVAELASALLQVPGELPDLKLALGFEHLLRMDHLDRVTLFEVEDERSVVNVRNLTYQCGPAGPAAEVSLDRFRWITKRLRHEQGCLASSVADLPLAASDTREYFEGHGIRSFAAFPLGKGESTTGALVFSSSTRDVDWNPALLRELQTVVDVFTSAQQRKRAQEALRAQHELNQTILDSLQSHLAVIDRDGKIMAINRSWREFWIANGGAIEAMPAVGSNYFVASADQCQECAEALDGTRDVLNGTRPWYETDYECSSPDRQRWFSLRVLPLLHSSGAVVLHRDITPRRQTEMKLRESEERFRVIADSAPVMIWMAAPNKRYTHFNRPWLEFTGRSLPQACGDGWVADIYQPDLDACLRSYYEAFDAWRPIRREYRMRRADGEYRWVLDTGVPRFLPDGTFAGYIGACVDITERKESEAARAKLSSMLIGAQEKERASISRELHDHICQRLALLAIGLQMFEASSVRLSKQHRQELAGLFNLTNEIAQDVQQVSHQLHSSPLQHLGLAAALRNLCLEFSRRGDIKAECICADVPVKVDEEVALALFRVAQEALRNAVKHGNASKVEVELSCQGRVLTLRVTDSGVGFDQAMTSGEGLGLVSMRERMWLVGGDLSVRSRPGMGTVVEARVALKEPSADLHRKGPVAAFEGEKVIA